jgi:hypothetical protein
MKYEWLVYAICAGLAWGTYVPIIFFGGSELGGKPNARLMAILCVGVAYFVIGVLFPLAMFLSGQYTWPDMKSTGLVFSSLAGVAGAVGAICVIFSTKAAVGAATEAGLPKDTFKIFIAPIIFGLAPILNTVVSLFWHPKGDAPFQVGLPESAPGWKLYVGILMVGLGAALVLFSKEEAEAGHTKPAVTTSTPTGEPAQP